MNKLQELGPVSASGVPENQSPCQQSHLDAYLCTGTVVDWSCLYAVRAMQQMLLHATHSRTSHSYCTDKNAQTYQALRVCTCVTGHASQQQNQHGSVHTKRIPKNPTKKLCKRPGSVSNRTNCCTTKQRHQTGPTQLEHITTLTQTLPNACSIALYNLWLLHMSHM